MSAWEKEAAKAVNKARTIVRKEQNRMYKDLPDTPGRAYRLEEIEEIGDLLHQAKAHIDPHDDVPWDYQTPLPF